MSGTRGVDGGSKVGKAVNGKGISGANSGGMGSIPQASKKMLQSLKEIVNCPEIEIYAMLKECNMDPNETVNRLLSQDPFHQVKSKKEKKKENKDATGLRSRSTGGTVNRGIRGGNDRYSHAILSQFSSSDLFLQPCHILPPESVGLPAKPSYKKDSWDTDTSSSSGPGVVGNNINRMPPAVSEASVEGKSLTVNNSEGVSSLQQVSGFHSPWSGVPGQVSMADIVKMGRPHVRGSSNATRSHQRAADHHVAESQFAPTPQELYSSQNSVAKANLNLGLGSQNVPEIDEWAQNDQPSTLSVPLALEPQITYDPYEDPSRPLFDRTNSHLDEVQCADDAEPDSVIPIKMQDELSGSAHILNDELHDSANSYKVQQHAYGHREDVAVSVSSVVKNVQQLSLSKEEEEDNSLLERESPVVKIPDHLQVRSSDCSHLSFGSFGSVMTAPSSGPPKCDVEETSTANDAQSLGHTDLRNSYEDEHLITASGGNSDHRLGVSSGTYDMPSAPQSEILKQEAPEVVIGHGNEYSFPSSSPNYTFENSQHLNPSLSHSQISSQMQNLPPLSGIMSYPNSMPSSLLPSNSVHADRDAERSYSPFPYSGSASAPMNVPSVNVSTDKPPSLGKGSERKEEFSRWWDWLYDASFLDATMLAWFPNDLPTGSALKTGNISSPQLTQNIPVSNIFEGQTFPQHLPLHPYSQPSLPFPNMISYPFLPQSYAYMQPAFQQAIAATSNSSYHAFQQAIAAAGNSTYHQSLSAGVIPQYKNSVSASNLPPSVTVPSGYGAFGNSTSNPTASSVNYEDILRAQYKETAHLLALQQTLILLSIRYFDKNESFASVGAGSRTMPAVPGSAYYSLQEQSHQAGGYNRQTQQQPLQAQQYGSLGPSYPTNFYHSQNGVPLEHQQQQQQMSRDGSLAGPQGQQQAKQQQQAQQMWQNNY
ncbi:LOW QUALITY PROTEIN: hypothetical protein V2J09_009354 [Rumex salicifolius]